MHGQKVGKANIMGSTGKDISVCLDIVLCKETPRWERQWKAADKLGASARAVAPGVSLRCLD